MTYTVGQLIQATDYNTFAQGGASPDANVANVNTIWGTGALDKGWGQSSPVTTVSVAATVTATQWSSLFTRFTTIANQTNTTVTAISNPTVGDTIAVKSNFSTNLTSCFTNRNNAPAVGSTITSGGAVTYSSAWQNSLTSVHTITFASANAARYFFNAGGIITWAGSKSGGSATAKNTAWQNLLTACGTLNITTGTSTQTIAGTSYTGTTKTGGSGTPTTLLTTIGFYDLTTSDQEVFKQYDSTYLYTGDYVTVNIKADAAAGSATVITITVLYQNATSGIDGLLETVDGSTVSTVTAVQPSLTYLSNTWGTPTLASTNPVGYDVTYLVVAGGGGGAYGGGGAGGLLTGTVRMITGATNTIVIGAGGSGSFYNEELPGFGNYSYNGFNSRLGAIVATGGGGSQGAGNAGGSGGGAGIGIAPVAGASGGAGITGQGYAGGSVVGTIGGFAGGGGASAVGASVSSSATGGAGGAGAASPITGSSVTYAGGGGGGGTTPGAGGAGGGGGGSTSATATSGTANTGGGGGGNAITPTLAGTGYGGSGGSGVVILSMVTAKYTGTTTGTPTVTTSGGNTIVKYTASGTYTS